MAPEQARGDEIDARCDLYAAGVMLYQMLTGSPPFVGPTPLSVLTAHLTSRPVPPREKAPDREISPALEAVVLHAMAKSPDDRYSTAVEMAAAILHARATPETLASVHPESLRVPLDGDGEVDGHGPTVPDLLNAPTTPPTPTPAPTSAKLASVMAPPSFELGPTGWKIVWIVATLASICVGVWLSLRTP
jgi:serine/threonine-protein kinase